MLELGDDGEIGLVNSPSAEATFKFLTEKMYRNYFYSQSNTWANTGQNFPEECCYISSYNKQIGGYIENKVYKKEFKSEQVTSYNLPYVWTLRILLDYENAKVTWQIGEDSWTTDMPSKGPLYLVYCTGSSVSSAKFLNPNK